MRTPKPRALGAVLVAAALGLAACGGTTGTAASPARPATATGTPTPAVIELKPFHTDQPCAGRPSPSQAPDPPVRFVVEQAGQPITVIEHRRSGPRCRPPQVVGANLSSSGRIKGWFSLEPDPVPGDYPSEQVKAGSKRLRLRGTTAWILGDPATPDAPDETWTVAWVENGSLQRYQSAGLSRQAVITMIQEARLDPANPDLLVPPRSSVNRITVTGARATSGEDWRVTYGTGPDSWRLIVRDSGPIDGPPFGSAPERNCQLLQIDGREILYGLDSSEGFDQNSDPIQTENETAIWTDPEGRLFIASGQVTTERLRWIVQHLTPA